MSTASPAVARHPASRPGDGRSVMSGQLVTSPVVNRLIGIGDLLLGAAGIPVALAFGNPWWHGLPFALLGVISGVLTMAMRPPHPASRGAHLLALSAACKPALAVLAALPHGEAMLPLAAATTTFLAFRIQGARPIAAYAVLSLVALAAVVMLGGGSAASYVGLIVAVPTMIGVAVAVAFVMGRVELQALALDAAVGNDPLTGVGNRRMLDDVLAYELERAARSGQPVSVLVLDLNGFKDLNDREGHPAGDALLVDVARVLGSAVRGVDTVTRLGGDEFCVVLPGAGTAQQESIAAAVAVALAMLTAGEGPLTAGIGVASAPDDGRDAATLLATADGRLYAHKARQRALPGLA